MTDRNPTALWYTRCPVPSPLGLAGRQGWLDETFKAVGIEIRSIADSRDRTVRESHFDHHLSWSFRQGGNIPAIWARANGRATRLVGITWTDEFQAVITLPGTGIRTIGDLVGRRFGVPRRVNDQIDFHRATALKGLVSALSLEGLGPDAIQLVDLAIEESVIQLVGDPKLFGLRRRHPYWAELAALARGEVDAIFVKGAEGIATANLIGATTVAEFGFHPDPKIRINNGTPRTLTVDETFAAERPDLVARLVEVVVRAGDWAAAHPDETLRIVAQEILATEESVLAAQGPDVHRHLRLGLDQDLVDAIAHYKDFLRDWGFLPGDFDVARWVDRTALDTVSARSAA